ncbi:hypothetical protein HY745_00025 [Candidatus Desantisbacteria bacterium]|nr:hypothetical protein [Candidatus Desantisbacteria bacterium]
MNKHPNFFLKSSNSIQNQYEALRAFHVDNIKASEVAKAFGYSRLYFNKLCSRFHKQIKNGTPAEFFTIKKAGNPGLKKNNKKIEFILKLREQGMSVIDIQVVLSSQGEYVSTKL